MFFHFPWWIALIIASVVCFYLMRWTLVLLLNQVTSLALMFSPPILLLTNWKRKYVHWGIEQIKKKKKLNRPWGSVLHRARKLSWNKFEALDIFRFIWSHVIPTAHMYTILLIIFHHQKLFSITGILNLFFIYIILLWIKSEVLLKHGCLYILSISGFSNVAND